MGISVSFLRILRLDLFKWWCCLFVKMLSVIGDVLQGEAQEMEEHTGISESSETSASVRWKQLEESARNKKRKNRRGRQTEDFKMARGYDLPNKKDEESMQAVLEREKDCTETLPAKENTEMVLEGKDTQIEFKEKDIEQVEEIENFENNEEVKEEVEEKDDFEPSAFRTGKLLTFKNTSLSVYIKLELLYFQVVIGL